MDAGAAVARAVDLVLRRSGLPVQTDLDRVPLGWCVERYRAGDWYAVLTRTGKRTHEDVTRALVRQLGADLDVNACDWPVVWSRALAGWRERGTAPTTVNKRRAVLMRVLMFCHDPECNGGQRGRVFAVPKLSGYQRARGQPRVRWLTRDEFIRLSHVLTPHRARWLALACWTGQRYDDVSSMAWKHVTDGVWRRRSTKTGAVIVDLPLPPELALFLGAPGPADALIVGRWGNSRRDLHAACARAGIAPVSVHDFRRTCATWLLESGAGRDAARLWLGLTDESRLLDAVYGRRGPAQARRDHADIRRALAEYSAPHCGVANAPHQHTAPTLVGGSPDGTALALVPRS